MLQKIGNRIKELRISKLNLSDEDFAKALGMDKDYLLRAEEGKEDLSIKKLAFICGKLGVSLNEFFTPFVDTKFDVEIQNDRNFNQKDDGILELVPEFLMNTGNLSPKDLLKKYFGYDSFRPGQEEIVKNILNGKDVLGVMPTGAGKSICYEIPALMLKGITIVISPLLSLMQDQVKVLNQIGIHAAYINSSLTSGQLDKALYNFQNGLYKIVYVAPERLSNKRFLYVISNLDISMITIDEAHCISQWGQDFRPDYLKIVDFVKTLKKRPILSAFTATATTNVREDIICILSLNNPFILINGFDRKNLYFEVQRKSDNGKKAYILDYISHHKDESGIIYCHTRDKVDEI